MIDYSKFSVLQLQKEFIDNETETDQYRETQPVAGLNQILYTGLFDTITSSIVSKHIDDLEEGDEIDTIEDMMLELGEASQDDFVLEVISWLSLARLGRYCGSAELKSILEKVFTKYVELGEHPYYETDEEIESFLEFCE